MGNRHTNPMDRISSVVASMTEHEALQELNGLIAIAALIAGLMVYQFTTLD